MAGAPIDGVPQILPSMPQKRPSGGLRSSAYVVGEMAACWYASELEKRIWPKDLNGATLASVLSNGHATRVAAPTPSPPSTESRWPRWRRPMVFHPRWDSHRSPLLVGRRSTASFYGMVARPVATLCWKLAFCPHAPRDSPTSG